MQTFYFTYNTHSLRIPPPSPATDAKSTDSNCFVVEVYFPVTVRGEEVEGVGGGEAE